VSRRTLIIGAVVALAALAYAFSRDEPPSAQLRALEADPMAAYVPPGGSLVDTNSQNEGTTFGKPVAARYRRMFELTDGNSARAFEHARTAAMAAGWIPLDGSPSRAFPDVFTADKSVPSGRIGLGVTVFADGRLLPDDVQPPALLVSLRHNGP
jgi:hypothetical protein